jgi:hypothetical protein
MLTFSCILRTPANPRRMFGEQGLPACYCAVIFQNRADGQKRLAGVVIWLFGGIGMPGLIASFGFTLLQCIVQALAKPVKITAKQGRKTFSVRAGCNDK